MHHPYLDHDGPIAFAHRGGDLDGLENSMAAFADAVAQGYRYLETDVHATRDGVLVAFHDASLDRVTDRTGRIAELRWEEVRRARIGGREPIPLLDEVLGTWPDIRVNIDVKADAAVGPLLPVLRRADVTDRVCVGSFSDARLRTIRRELGPRLCTSAGSDEGRRLLLAARLGPLGRVLPVGAACVQIPTEHEGRTLVDARFVAHCHARGLPVHVWTVNERHEMERLLDLGVDGIMTDATRTLVEVLRGRGQWTDPRTH